MAPSEVVAIGELLVEIMRKRVDSPLDRADDFVGPFPSGAPAIFADQVARLGHSVAFVGAVGQDDFGKCLLDRFEADGVDASYVAEIEGSRFVIASVPVKKPAEQEHAQKNVVVTFKRFVDVEGMLVPILGEGGVIEIQMNNDGSLLNASKIWRELVGYEQWEPVKPFEKALDEARRQIEEPWVYELDNWAWGYVEEAGNVEQEVMRLVLRFWFAPIDPEGVRKHPPVMIEIPA